MIASNMDMDSTTGKNKIDRKARGGGRRRILSGHAGRLSRVLVDRPVRKLSVLTRSDGSVQAAYDGHPLYTHVGDSAPGQANGNGLNLNGGLWHEVTASG